MSQPKLPRCPRCDFRMIPQPERERLWCQACGYERTDAQAIAFLNSLHADEKKSVFPIGFQPDLTHPSNPQLEAMLEAAVEALEAGNKKAARYICDDLLNQNHRLVDAYYILYVAAESDLEKARHLASILVLDPPHRQAKRELARLKQVVKEEIKPSFFTVDDYREEINETIQAKGHVEDCPMCGGHTLYVQEDEIKCLSCNYTPAVGSKVTKAPLADAPLRTHMPPDGGFHSLREALWQRKYGGGKEWVIAKRVLACQNCGAQLTLSRTMMSQQCAFCDSQHILFQDTLGSFQEPDGILPAHLNEQEAIKAYLAELPVALQKRVVRYEMVGIYLPYWSFRGQRGQVLVPGSREPSLDVLKDLMPFDLNHLRPYDQRYLASWSAQLYTDDVIQASVVVGALSNELLEYRLLLLPIWMTTIHLTGGGYYHSLINAQTGEVVVTERVDSTSVYRPQKSLGDNESVIRPLPPRT